MEDEIFGPILPVIAFENLDDVINKIKEKRKATLPYMFTPKTKK